MDTDYKRSQISTTRKLIGIVASCFTIIILLIVGLLYKSKTADTCPNLPYQLAIITGPPGAGKGTQAKFIEEKYCMCHFSTGDLKRNAIADKDSELGKQLRKYKNWGDWKGLGDPELYRL